MILKDSKFLIIGGGGLVGTSIIIELLERKYKNIVSISLKNNGNANKLKQLEKKYHIKISNYLGNVLVTKKYSSFTLNQIINNPKKKQDLLKLLDRPLNEKDIVNNSFLYKVFEKEKPDYIIDCINTATQCSYFGNNSSIINAGIGIYILMRYFQLINNLLNKKVWGSKKIKYQPKVYLKVGTTGVGGMGLNMPFTHGEERPSMALLKKIAMAGAQNMLLFAIRNNNSKTSIKEVIPATAVFGKNVKQAKEKKVIIDGGESGNYSLEEFRLLSNKNQMGFIDSKTLSRVILRVLNSEHKKNILEKLESGVIRSPKNSIKLRKNILRKGKKFTQHNGIYSISYGRLGPKLIQKFLFEAKIFYSFFSNNKKTFFHIDTGKLSSQIKLWVMKNKVLKYELNNTNIKVSSNSRKESNEVYINLSKASCKQWRQYFIKLGLQKSINQFNTPGDIISELLKRNEIKELSQTK